jgi:hypothetical protein
MKKAIGGLFTPLMAFWNLVPWPSSGAGYDDLNNNAYRNSDGVGENGPACESVGHRRN